MDETQAEKTGFQWTSGKVIIAGSIFLWTLFSTSNPASSPAGFAGMIFAMGFGSVLITMAIFSIGGSQS